MSWPSGQLVSGMAVGGDSRRTPQVLALLMSMLIEANGVASGAAASMEREPLRIEDGGDGSGGDGGVCCEVNVVSCPLIRSISR